MAGTPVIRVCRAEESQRWRVHRIRQVNGSRIDPAKQFRALDNTRELQQAGHPRKIDVLATEGRFDFREMLPFTGVPRARKNADETEFVVKKANDLSPALRLPILLRARRASMDDNIGFRNSRIRKEHARPGKRLFGKPHVQ